VEVRGLTTPRGYAALPLLESRRGDEFSLVVPPRLEEGQAREARQGGESRSGEK